MKRTNRVILSIQPRSVSDEFFELQHGAYVIKAVLACPGFALDRTFENKKLGCKVRPKYC